MKNGGEKAWSPRLLYFTTLDECVVQVLLRLLDFTCATSNIAIMLSKLSFQETNKNTWEGFINLYHELFLKNQLQLLYNGWVGNSNLLLSLKP